MLVAGGIKLKELKRNHLEATSNLCSLHHLPSCDLANDYIWGNYRNYIFSMPSDILVPMVNLCTNLVF